MCIEAIEVMTFEKRLQKAMPGHIVAFVEFGDGLGKAWEVGDGNGLLGLGDIGHGRVMGDIGCGWVSLRNV